MLINTIMNLSIHSAQSVAATSSNNTNFNSSTNARMNQATNDLARLPWSTPFWTCW
ncbi:hypothetical protein PPL_07994 [Heterostelium album PN500]|uniref:Uncharacterized protein n=1 Tax=Heterostelium pallidum (strain ATCC 26659 / Pp 5 / PN500) TaxID=670386 RepID=D3BHJ2_HETP5|nr:hypothetical protein PPL_07994 [Heterostelium album PN500]EFA79169.1 hypothetical protein PPL_07994 [Heterostelium album PN500]|eukprot:XP_020431290.1 hypothetical protein PPL_07994 [Heterostelium album PN500]